MQIKGTPEQPVYVLLEPEEVVKVTGVRFYAPESVVYAGTVPPVLPVKVGRRYRTTGTDRTFTVRGGPYTGNDDHGYWVIVYDDADAPTMATTQSILRCSTETE